MNKHFEYLKVEILHDLKQKKLSQNYYTKQKKNYQNLYNFIKLQKNFLLIILISFENFFLILKASFIQIFYNKNKNKNKNKVLIIIDEKKVDQISNLLIYKILKSNNISFVIINKSKREILSENPKKKGDFRYENFFSLNVFIFFIYNSIINLKKYFFFLRKNKLLSKNLFYLFKIYLRFIQDYCIVKKINDYFSPSFIYINQNSLNQQNIISAFKSINNKIQIIGNSFNGLKFSNQKITGEYLWNNIDHLLCYGRMDLNEFKKMHKKNYLFPPKNIYAIGSPRDYIFKKKNKYKVRSKRCLNILFIKSNPNMQNNVDERALKLIIETLETLEFQKNISLTIKDRAQSNQQSNINNLLKKYTGSIKTIRSETQLTEKLIFENDLILGTYSTSFIYQSIYFKKPIIQIFGNEIYWTDLNKQGVIICNNRSYFKKQITKFYYDKKIFRKNYRKKIINLRSKIFRDGDVKTNLEKQLIKLLN